MPGNKRCARYKRYQGHADDRGMQMTQAAALIDPAGKWRKAGEVASDASDNRSRLLSQNIYEFNEIDYMSLLDRYHKLASGVNQVWAYNAIYCHK